MRNLKSIIAILAISLSTVFSINATEKKPTKITKELRSEIISLIGKNIPLVLKSTSSAEISFMVNNKNELIVFSVDSKEKEFNSYIKTKLNYKKVNVKGTKKGEIYRMPVKINIK
ncbi:hypothetical protein [uncultured Polaribacter sp.]|uniref:hypothetical protein n=1 Tax=uncultured Polaribacter sp. TaxID=174711 RepID=UPI00261B64FD|nr:hypothetical protein [uncultured Polaribacter sp.]